MVFVFGVSVKEGNNDQRKNKGLGDGGEIWGLRPLCHVL
jgi:hypothetical protein